MKLKVFEIVALVSILGGLLGLTIYSSFLHKVGPLYGTNKFVGVWLSTLVIFFSFQTFYLVRSPHVKQRFWWKLELWLESFIILVLVLLFLGYSAGHHLDGIFWSLALIFVNLVNLYLVYSMGKDKINTENLLLPRPPQSDEKNYKSWRAFVIFFAILKACSVLFLILMLGGAWTLGAGYIKYGPRGKFVHVEYASGRTQKIHYLCEGPTDLDNNTHTFWFEVGGGHTMCDFYGLHEYIVANNRRSCIYDRPGLGWSGYFIPNQPDWYYQMLVQTGEKAPFILVSWAGGADYTLNFANEHPSMVSSYVMLDVAGANEEWDGMQNVSDWTDAQRDQYEKEQLKSRYALFDAIRAVATPFGWMPFFLPNDPNYIPRDRYDEFRWHQYLEKHWASQFFMLKDEVDHGSPLDDVTSFPSTVNVVSIYSTQSNETLCGSQKLALDSDDCKMQIKLQDYWVWSKMDVFNTMAKFAKNSLLVECKECTLAFPVANATWTAQTLLDIFTPNSTIN
eukprot:TRINITY_DN2835_c0_g1_i1.p1 TRINITY_DN2835_c0_g1~~TRINITY_DN2835_c0_g1_i1.p1  ORF type:complete len:507 (-),score=78.84 TRINITY_DN2835_c0_g1_i1:94-1614(-)